MSSSALSMTTSSLLSTSLPYPSSSSPSRSVPRSFSPTLWSRRVNIEDGKNDLSLSASYPSRISSSPSTTRHLKRPTHRRSMQLDNMPTFARPSSFSPPRRTISPSSLKLNTQLMQMNVPEEVIKGLIKKGLPEKRLLNLIKKYGTHRSVKSYLDLFEKESSQEKTSKRMKQRILQELEKRYGSEKTRELIALFKPILGRHNVNQLPSLLSFFETIGYFHKDFLSLLDVKVFTDLITRMDTATPTYDNIVLVLSSVMKAFESVGYKVETLEALEGILADVSHRIGTRLMLREILSLIERLHILMDGMPPSVKDLKRCLAYIHVHADQIEVWETRIHTLPLALKECLKDMPQELIAMIMAYIGDEKEMITRPMMSESISSSCSSSCSSSGSSSSCSSSSSSSLFSLNL